MYCNIQLKIISSLLISYQFLMHQKGKIMVYQAEKAKRRRLPKAYKQRVKRQQKKGFNFQTCPDELQGLWQQNCDYINIQLRKKIFKKKIVSNFISSLNYRAPINSIFTLYGMITIDENALKQQSKDQSLINSIFNFYSLTEVQTNPNYLLLKIQKNKQNYYPIPYFIERFRAFGDNYFYQMANKIQMIYTVFQSFKHLPPPASISIQQINRYIQMLQGKQYMLRITPNMLIFSKQLIKVSGCSIQHLAHQCLNYKSFVSEFFLADDYRGQINKFFQLFQLGIKLRKGQITQQNYMELTIQRQTQYILNSEQTVVKVITSKYNLAPGVGCWQIQKIVGQEELNKHRYKYLPLKKQSFLEKNVWKELQKLDQLLPLPENRRQSNQNKVCSYRQIQ